MCCDLNINTFAVYEKCAEFIVRGTNRRGAASGKNSTEIVPAAAVSDGRLRSLRTVVDDLKCPSDKGDARDQLTGIRSSGNSATRFWTW